MELAFEITRDDFWQFNRFIMRRRMARLVPRPLRWILVLLMGFAILLAGVATIVSKGFGWAQNLVHSPLFPVLLAMAGTALSLGIVLLLMKPMVRRLPREDGGILGPHRVRITEQGVASDSAKAQGFYRWEGVLEIAQDPGMIYLMVDHRAAVLVPKRAFADGIEMARFLSVCRDFRARAGAGVQA